MKNITIYLLFFAFSYGIWSADSINPCEQLFQGLTEETDNKLPPFAAQIEEYKKIYKEHIKNKKDDLGLINDNKTYDYLKYTNQDNIHIDGLYKILKRGFFHSHKFIQKNLENNLSKKVNIQNKFNQLCAIATALEAEQKLGLNQFLKINLYATMLVDESKVTDELPKAKDPNGFSFQNYNYPNDVERVIRDLELKLKTCQPLDGKFQAGYVLYSLNSRTSKSISPKAYNKIYLDDEFSGNIYLFHINAPYLLNSKPGTKVNPKTMPHHGRFGSTSDLFKHDIAHANEQCKIELSYTQLYNSTYGMTSASNQPRQLANRYFKDDLKNLVYEINGWENDAVINNALFLLNHELFNVLDIEKISYGVMSLIIPDNLRDYSDDNYIINEANYKYLKLILQGVKYHMVESTKKNRQQIDAARGNPYFSGYKVDKKDHEFILGALTTDDFNKIVKEMNPSSSGAGSSSNIKTQGKGWVCCSLWCVGRDPDESAAPICSEKSQSKNPFSRWKNEDKQKAVAIGYRIFWDKIIEKLFPSSPIKDKIKQD